MKRSEINKYIDDALILFEKYNIHLPKFGYLKGENTNDLKEYPIVLENELGWDVTDFGFGNFEKKGLLLFTIRNGNLVDKKKTYAEKVLVVQKNQVTPLHYHWYKTEDIINRNGGRLVIQFYGSNEDDSLSKDTVELEQDGRIIKVEAGGKIILNPGESVTITPRIYHSFWAEDSVVIVGEVSQTNDDHTDNNFFDKTSRFSKIEEDEEIKYLLCNEYERIGG